MDFEKIKEEFRNKFGERCVSESSKEVAEF